MLEIGFIKAFVNDIPTTDTKRYSAHQICLKAKAEMVCGDSHRRDCSALKNQGNLVKPARPRGL